VAQLTDVAFAELFGTTPERVRAHAGTELDAADWSFEPLCESRRDALVLQSLHRIHTPRLAHAGEHRAAEWDQGWRENYDEFVASGFDKRKLVPKYVKEGVPVRLQRAYVQPSQRDFVYRYTRVFRAWLFREHLAPYSTVYEIGCGTGDNLMHFAELFPEAQLHGLDWAPSSQDILRAAAVHHGVRLAAARFDFFAPDPALRLAPGSAVLTFGALEQVGPRHGAYLDFILTQRPALCVDVVGIGELYEEDELLDYLALLYHRRRQYLDGYLTRLRELAAGGRIAIEAVHHQRFGNPFDDPYSYIVWRPL
jgi:SAM-dependent methyltransferase